MMTGLGPARSYAVANKIEEELIANGREAVSEDALFEITLRALRKEAGDKYAESFVKLQSISDLDIPLIVLIGGATGVGKSTIATQLASRLGITRVVSTDAVREVLRSALTAEMFPTLYASSFEADKAVRQPIPHSADRLIIGFREQAAAVAVGTRALITRAIEEGTDMILEGAHLVPGFLEGVDTDRAVIVPLVVMVEDENSHRSHFYRRTRDSRNRPSSRYINNFRKIRSLQKYMVTSALVRGVPVISHYDLDESLSQTIDQVLTKTLEAVARGSAADGNEERLLERVAEPVDNDTNEGSNSRETVS